MQAVADAFANDSISSCIKSSCAALASGVVFCHALSKRHSMFVASARASFLRPTRS
jgi:hypothetical protein